MLTLAAAGLAAVAGFVTASFFANFTVPEAPWEILTPITRNFKQQRPATVIHWKESQIYMKQDPEKLAVGKNNMHYFKEHVRRKRDIPFG